MQGRGMEVEEGGGGGEATRNKRRDQMTEFFEITLTKHPGNSLSHFPPFWSLNFNIIERRRDKYYNYLSDRFCVFKKSKLQSPRNLPQMDK